MRLAKVIIPRLAWIAISSACLLADPALRIVSPPDGAVFEPGQTMHVQVSATGGTFLGVALLGQDAIPWPQTILTSPPYDFWVALPSKIKPGIYSMSALSGTSEHGRLRSKIISFDVERSDSPESVSLDVSNTLRLDVGGQTSVRVFGLFRDGTHLEVTRSTKTKYHASPLGIIAVNREGFITAISPGQAELSVNGQVFVKVKVRAK